MSVLVSVPWQASRPSSAWIPTCSSPKLDTAVAMLRKEEAGGDLKVSRMLEVPGQSVYTSWLCKQLKSSWMCLSAW